jgi:phage shock protein PspC (stress-responsive transcriptional regulator)
VTNLPVLRRDSTRRVVGGVCAGLARTWNVDPLLVRAALVVAMVVTSGLALFMYLSLWLVIPTDRSFAQPRRVWTPARTLIALGLVAGATALLVPEGRPATVGFVILGLLGIAWYASVSRRRRTPPPPAPLTEQQWRQPPMPGRPAATLPPAYAAASPAYQPSPYVQQPTYASQAYPYGRRPPRPRAWRPVIIGTLLAWIGLRLAESADVSVQSVAYPAAALAMLGLGLVAASRPSRAMFGRPRGLVGAGLATALLTMSMMPPAPVEPASTHRIISSAADLSPTIDLGVGTHTLDLSALTLDGDRTVTVNQDAGALTLILPKNAGVNARYAVDAGSITTPEQSLSGMDQQATESYLAAGKPTLTIVVQVSLGTLEVQR